MCSNVSKCNLVCYLRKICIFFIKQAISPWVPKWLFVKMTSQPQIIDCNHGYFVMIVKMGYENIASVSNHQTSHFTLGTQMALCENDISTAKLIDCNHGYFVMIVKMGYENIASVSNLWYTYETKANSAHISLRSYLWYHIASTSTLDKVQYWMQSCRSEWCMVIFSCLATKAIW